MNQLHFCKNNTAKHDDDGDLDDDVGDLDDGVGDLDDDDGDLDNDDGNLDDGVGDCDNFFHFYLWSAIVRTNTELPRL